MEAFEKIERSIITTYRGSIWRKFVSAIKEYNLIQDGDKIAVCISGGKDSFLLAKCFQELKRHGKNNFNLEFIVMDPGYNKINREKIEENAKKMNIPIQIFNSDIFEVAYTAGGSPCYLCARMRRGFLYKKAQELGCNKIALGHHFDDVIETILMGILYNGQYQSMMPKLRSKNFNAMELIRPLYLVKEKDILAWKNYNQLEFIACACKFTEENKENDTGISDSKRLEMKMLIKNLKKNNPNVDINIFRSMYNINLNTVIEYTKGDEKHNFLQEY